MPVFHDLYLYSYCSSQKVFYTVLVNIIEILTELKRHVIITLLLTIAEVQR